MRDFKGIIDWSENKKVVNILSKTGDCDIEELKAQQKLLPFHQTGEERLNHLTQSTFQRESTFEIWLIKLAEHHPYK